MTAEYRVRDGAPARALLHRSRALRGMPVALEHLRAQAEAALQSRIEPASTLAEILNTLNAASVDVDAELALEYESLLYASHELRTPLTIVLTNLELLVTHLEGEPAQLAHAALHATSRMVRLVEDLLLLSRIEADRPLPRAAVDLGDVVIDVIEELAPLAVGHRLAFEAGDAVVLGVRDDLHRLLLNLAANALRHTPHGTHIDIRTATHRARAIVTIEDDGPGVPPRLADRIFDRFTHTTDTTSGGSGLGLMRCF